MTGGERCRTVGPVTRRPPGGDIALAAGIAVVQVAGTFLAGRHQVDRESFDVLAAALLLAGPAALSSAGASRWRSTPPPSPARWPMSSLGYPRGPIFFSLIVAFLTVVLAGHRVVGWVGLAVGYVAFLWAEVVFQDVHAPGWAALVGLGAWLLVLAAAGEGLRIRRVRAEETARAREEEARRRAGEERLRSPASCTTCWPTTSPSSTCRPAWPCT